MGEYHGFQRERIKFFVINMRQAKYTMVLNEEDFPPGF